MWLFTVLFLAILPLGHDLHFHLYRIGSMAEELIRSDYRIPIRMLSSSFNNYGYGTPLFYGDTLLYIPALFVTFGMSETFALKLLIVSIFWLSFFSMKFHIYRVKNDVYFANVTAFCYVMASYFLIDLCIRMSIGEASAFIFLPFVFCSFYNMTYNPQKNDWIYLAIGMSGLLLSHNLTFLFTSVILFIWTIIKIKQLIKNKVFYKVFLSSVVFLGMTSTFLFPMLEAMSVQEYQTPGINEYQITYFILHKLDFIDFFIPYEIKKIFNVILGTNFDIENWHPGAIGLTWVLIIVLIFINKNRKEKRNKVLLCFFIITSCIYVFSFIKPIVAFFSRFLSFMQFGWRLFVFCSFVFAIILGYEWCKLTAKRQSVVLGIVILLGVYTIGGRYAYQVYLNSKGMEYISEINPDFADHYIMEYSPNAADNLYLPKGVDWHTFENRGDVVESINSKLVSITHYYDKNKLYITVDNHGNEEVSLELPLYYYKGYVSIDRDDNEYYPVSKSINGLVQTTLKEKDVTNLVVYYKGTIIQNISYWITVSTYIVLLAVLIYRKKFKS